MEARRDFFHYNGRLPRTTRRLLLALGVLLVSSSLSRDYRSLKNFNTSVHSITTVQPFNVIANASSSSSQSASSTYTTTTNPNHDTSTVTTIDSRADINIFYNIFLPTDPEGMARAITIVKEQLDIIGTSSFIAGKNASRTVIHYATIGHALNGTEMQEWCELYGLICRHVQHYESGNEYLTLEHVREFCAATSHNNNNNNNAVSSPSNDTTSSARVTYIHSKGSFHDNDFNELWRKILTAAAVDEKCLRPPDDRCNVCGLQFYPLWTLFFPGNFWTASCSYINTLLPLTEYERKLRQVHEMIERSDKFTRTLFEWDDNVLGYGRYAAELWIGSSPSLIPCDVSKESDIWYWIDVDKNADEFEFAMAPRHAIIHDRRPVTRADVVAQIVPNASRYEYFLLGGHLIKWQALYGIVPNSDSWIWDFFPDGHDWLRDAMYGELGELYNTIMHDESPSREI